MLQHIVLQLCPLGDARLLILRILLFCLIQIVAGIHVHVIHHDTVTTPQRHLITAEALGHHLVEGMAELAEVLLPGGTGNRRHREVVFPTTHQTVALEAVVLQVQVVDGASHHIHVAGPLVHLIVILQEHRQHVVVIEVLLKHHQVIVFLQQVFTDSCRSTIPRTFGVDIEHH